MTICNSGRRQAPCFLQAQAQLGLGQTAKSKALLKKVFERDPNHAFAADLFATTR
jgi:hypothetical protein